MSRVIQLISHNQHLFALTDDGEIFQLRKRRVKCRVEEYWKKFSSPCESTPTQEPESAIQASFLEQFAKPSERTRHKPTHVLRRPTSIGSDGNYLPPLGD